MRLEDLDWIIIVLKVLVPEESFFYWASDIISFDHFFKKPQQIQQFLVLAIVIVG